MSYRILYPTGQPLGRWGRGTTFPTAPQTGDKFYREDLDHEFEWDASRSRWLGQSETFEFAHLTAVTNGYSFILNQVLAPNVYGHRWPYDVCIVAMRANVKLASSPTFTTVIGVSASTSLVLSAANFAETSTANALVTAGSVVVTFVTGTASQGHHVTYTVRRTAS